MRLWSIVVLVAILSFSLAARAAITDDPALKKANDLYDQKNGSKPCPFMKSSPRNIPRTPASWNASAAPRS